ncbi:predicted protein [Nematostella vectensis]|uniref:VIT domain-containing protein n=1 Tax=Nematostella vectensis TaxID=45351 RepID=A7RNW5_NEMVE|nr:predicted protein [Nematostella vectensis]|eukprot:XP_001638810.1 predicted protein [Nematostella vectensis]
MCYKKQHYVNGQLQHHSAKKDPEKQYFTRFIAPQSFILTPFENSLFASLPLLLKETITMGDMNRGLICKKTKEKIPLQSIKVNAEITGYTAQVAAVLGYKNEGSNPIEAVYIFPLDEQAAVCGFQATIDGRTIVAEIKEKEEARGDYDDAISSGHSAFLLEESDESSDIFQMNVGNLPPNESATLQLKFVTELEVDEENGTVQFVLPTVLNPRYTPVDQQPSISTEIPASSVAKPYSFEFQMNVIRTLRRALQPALTNVALSWALPDGWKLQEVQSKLPPVFKGERLIAYGVFKNLNNDSNGKGIGHATVKATLHEGREAKHIENTVKFVLLPNQDNSLVLHRLAAKRFISSSQSALHKQDIIQLSETASVASKFTSFIAIDSKSHKPVTGAMVRKAHPKSLPPKSLPPKSLPLKSPLKTLPRRCLARPCPPPPPPEYRAPSPGVCCRPPSPPPLPLGEKASRPCPPPPEYQAPSPGVCCRPPSPPPLPLRMKASRPCPPPLPPEYRAPSPGVCCRPPSYPPLPLRMKASRPCPPPPPPEYQQSAPGASSDKLMTLVDLQKACGSWELTDALAACLNVSKDVLVNAKPQSIPDLGSDIWATVLVLVWLSGKLFNRKDEWEMIANKSKHWLKSSLPSGVDYGKLMGDAFHALEI